MTRPLLAATDFSPAAAHAATRAALLAAEHHWPLSLAHVLNQSALAHLGGLFRRPAEPLQGALRQHVREELEHQAQALAERYGVAIEPHLEEGAVTERLLAEADRQDARLLVMGVQGERPFGRGLLGSTVDRVLHDSDRPLLVVKTAPQRPYRRVLVPVDFSSRSHAALALAGSLAPHAEQVVLHAYDIPFEAKLHRAGLREEEMSALLLDLQHQAAQAMETLLADQPDSGAPRVRRLVHGEPGRRIVEQQQAADCDLVVLAKRGLGRLQRWLLGSVGHHVLAQAECDVLLVNEPPA